MPSALHHTNRRPRRQPVKPMPSVLQRRPPLPKAADLSLVFFTLLTQSAVGLVFVATLGPWLDTRIPTVMAERTLALVLTAAGLVAALTHLAAPRRAHHALRNSAFSWLSREVLLVPMFALALVLSMAAQSLGSTTALFILGVTTSGLGLAALWAMTGVYLLKTVPAWNTPATILEFIGTALLLGGALSIVSASLGAGYGWGPAYTVAGTGMGLGWILKLAAIPPGIAAEHRARVQLWYPPPTMILSAAHSRAVRLVFNGAGMALVMAGAAKGFQLEILSGLIILFAAEVAGRMRFFKLYGRIGL